MTTGLLGMARRCLAVARRVRLRLYDWSVRSRLAAAADMQFTVDYVSPHTSDWLEALAPFVGRPQVRMLEVGSLEGRSAVWFLENVVTHPSAELTCVDRFTVPGVQPRFDHNVALARSEARLVKHRGDSAEVLVAMAPESFDIVYVDADHRAAGALLDTLLGWRLLRPGGVMILDDYLWRPDKALTMRPQLAVDLFLEAAGDNVTVVHHDYQVIVAKPA